MIKKILYQTCLILLSIVFFLFAQNFLPDDRKGDWSQAGYLRFLTEDFIILKINSVQDYGATNDGNDSNNNNHDAIMDAIEDRDSSELIQVYFPAGTYKVSSSIEIFNMEKASTKSGSINALEKIELTTSALPPPCP